MTLGTLCLLVGAVWLAGRLGNGPTPDSTRAEVHSGMFAGKDGGELARHLAECPVCSDPANGWGSCPEVHRINARYRTPTK
jgi:hypothetical protein